MATARIDQLRTGLRRRADMFAHRGDAVFCPACGHSFARFKDAWNRPDALCWRCGAHERHRALALLLGRRPELLDVTRGLLHFAPEWCISQLVDPRINPALTYRYVSTDLDPVGVDLPMDITDMTAVGDGEFDAVICSHVLEHVPDDRAAMLELARITAPGGWCLIMVPLDAGAASSYEDSAITDPAERVRAFGQHDHVRLYGLDVADRLTAAGLTVERISPQEAFPDELDRCRLLGADLMWLCRPSA
jgi:SAM-dependent methyltransferase